MPSELTLEPVASAPQTARRWVERELEHRRARRSRRLSRPGRLRARHQCRAARAQQHRRPRGRRATPGSGSRCTTTRPDLPTATPSSYPARRDNESTIGRGLQIVDSISYAWGVSYEHLGKCVWFNPAPDEPARDRARPRRLTRSCTASVATTRAPRPTSRVVDVQLVDLPVNLIAHYQSKFFDLRREMTLIDLSQLAHRHGRAPADRALGRGWSRCARIADTGLRRSMRARRAGLDRVTVILPVPTSMLAEIREFQQLLAEADEFCRREQLLTLAAGTAGAGAALLVSRRADRPARRAAAPLRGPAGSPSSTTEVRVLVGSADPSPVRGSGCQRPR